MQTRRCGSGRSWAGPECKVGWSGVALQPQGAYQGGSVGAMMVVQTRKTQDASDN